MRRYGLKPACRYQGNGAGGALPEAGTGQMHLQPEILVWSYDFVFDACANGQQLKCLTLVDEYIIAPDAAR